MIIPKALTRKILEELRHEHMGVAKMKSLARSYVWWPGITKDLETLAKACTQCSAVLHIFYIFSLFFFFTSFLTFFTFLLKFPDDET